MISIFLHPTKTQLCMSWSFVVSGGTEMTMVLFLTTSIGKQIILSMFQPDILVLLRAIKPWEINL